MTDTREPNDNIGGSGIYANKISYEYDPLGRLVKVVDQNDYELTYTYTADDQKKTIKVNDDNPTLIYHIEYDYDAALRLIAVEEPLLSGENDYIALFDYEDECGCGCSSKYDLITYSLDGTDSCGVTIDYTYNRDKVMIGYETTGGITFKLEDVNVDGLGRLWDANETITNTSGNPVVYSHHYQYDRMSQLTNAAISNIDGNDWTTEYTYSNNGNIKSRKIQGSATSFEYDGDLITGDSSGNNVDWDKNGRQTSLLRSNTTPYQINYDWDGRLRSNRYGPLVRGMEARYTPDGVRIYKKQKEWFGSDYSHKYIVDAVGDFPVILLVLDANDNDAILKTNIHANGQILMQHDGDYTDTKYFFLHDRLGSVRQVIDTSANVKNRYTYNPFGEVFTTEIEEDFFNPYRFAGYFWDPEAEQYLCFQRMYYPTLQRFTTHDPVAGDFKEPLSLHAYLYCASDPINRTDPSGELWGALHRAARIVNAANVRNMGFATILNSDNDLLGMAVSLAMISNQVADYVDDNTKEKIDYASGPEAFRHLGVTKKECADLGKYAAEYKCNLRMAIHGGLQSGLYYAAGAVGVGAGVVAQKAGYDLIKSQNYIAGIASIGVGFVSEYAGYLSAKKAIKITVNAYNANKTYCNCDGL